jgi:hypothetical protein
MSFASVSSFMALAYLSIIAFVKYRASVARNFDSGY